LWSAFSQRDAAHNVSINARHVAWARDFFSAMQPHADGRAYLNFLSDEGAERVRQAYGDRQYERLVELKRAYDPTNFFRLNQNIEP
jgi:FAD/FMN-containing dehydrogenase